MAAVFHLITSAFLLIVLGMIFVNVMARLKDESNRYAITIMIVAVFLYIVNNSFRTFNTEFYPEFFAKYISLFGFIGYFVMISVPYLWVRFSFYFLNVFKKVKYRLIVLIPWAINLSLVIFSCFKNDVLWNVDEFGIVVENGRFQPLFSGINLLYYVFPSFLIIYLIIFHKYEKRLTLISVFLFSIGPAIGTFIFEYILQGNFSYPYMSFFYVLGVLFAYAYLISDLFEKIYAEKENSLIQKELKERELNEAIKKAEQDSLISSVAEGFSFIGILDVDDERISEVHSSEHAGHFFGVISEEVNSYDGLRIRLSKLVHSEELERFMICSEKEKVLAEVRENLMYKFDTRFVLDGRDFYFRVKFTSTEQTPNKIVVGVLNDDEQVRRELEKGSMEGYKKAKSFADTFLHSYVSAYYVDLNDYTYVVFHRVEELQSIYTQNKNYYEAAKVFIDRHIEEEDKERLIDMVNPSYIKERLKDEEFFSVYMRDKLKEEKAWYRLDVIRGADSDHAGIAFTNVTDKIEEDERIKEKLEEARIRADASSRAKTLFLFNMSHDIRTPMNAISGFTAIAKKNIDDTEKVMDCLDKIDVSSSQLLSLVNQVLEMSRIESGKFELIEKPYDLSQSYNEMTPIFKSQAQDKNILYLSEMRNIKHNYLIADSTRIAQIVLNVVGNALKYTNTGGRIECIVEEIESKKEGYAYIRLTVSDNGVGISEEFMKRLYEPFSREKSATISKIQGTGLGMSIVKELVDLMDGLIQVESEKGKGTRFDITMPMKINNDMEKEKEEKVIRNTADLKDKKVLLVEDNELNREIAHDILEDRSLKVYDANDGSVAVELIEKMLTEKDSVKYDFVLMDLQMPIMNGFEATKKIREMEKEYNIHTPIIAMTANAFEEDRQKSLEAGMDEHLSKPVNPAKIIEMLSRFNNEKQ